MIITITLNPAIDKTVEIPNFEIGAVNRVYTMRVDAGGKGINVSKVIKSLKGESKAVGIIGGTGGTFIKEFLDRSEIENNFHIIDGETRTNLKIIDSSKKTNTDINEQGPLITFEDIEAVRRIALADLKAGDVVVMSGSVPANVDKSIYGSWIREAKKAGAKTILDADGDLLKHGVEAGPFLVKPNIHELKRLVGIELLEISDVEKYGSRLIEKYGIEIVVVSLGSQGAVFINGECSILAHNLEVEVKSTVGAGDSMVAALAYSIDKGYSLEKAVVLAMATSNANVMTSGSQAADYETIAELQKNIKFEYINK